MFILGKGLGAGETLCTSAPMVGVCHASFKGIFTGQLEQVVGLQLQSLHLLHSLTTRSITHFKKGRNNVIQSSRDHLRVALLILHKQQGSQA